VGIIVGTYSSIFFATPLLVSLRERTGKVRTHTRRVLNRRQGAAAPAELATAVAGEGSAVEAAVGAGEPVRPRRPSGKQR
jgi:preprotein translocase subunit SecF